MFENLDLRQFTWKREPVLYVTLAIAILSVVANVLGGDVDVGDGIEAAVKILLGFIVRGEVTPVRTEPVNTPDHPDA